MTNKCFNSTDHSIGDLVWIPANTPLMYCLPKEEYGLSFRSIDKKEPMYGLIISQEKNNYRVLIGKEEFYVQKKQVYGVEE